MSEATKRFEGFSAAGDSHPGLVRKNNEDNYVYNITSDGRFVMAAVADGIGGHENGELASALTVKMLLEAWNHFTPLSGNESQSIVDFLNAALSNINGAVFNLNASYNIRHPMGTTIASLVMGRDFAVTAHAGDSRVYRLRDGVLTQLTRDHSYVGELVAKGKLSREDAERHPLAHVINRSIGITPKLEADIQLLDNRPGDRYMICSDGLMLHVPDAAISEIMAHAETSRDAVRMLIASALRGGGADNTTVICVFSC